MIDARSIEDAIAAAFEETVRDYFDECQRQLNVVRWSWPRATQTISRGVKTSPREINDTGELEQSGSVSVDGRSGRLTWDAPHAAAVYLGSVRGGSIQPARPWADVALEEMDLGRTMKRHLQERL